MPRLILRPVLKICCRSATLENEKLKLENSASFLLTTETETFKVASSTGGAENMKIKNQWLRDIESRGELAFNKGLLKSYSEAERYARKTYQIVIEREIFVAGWNMAFWNEQERVLKRIKRTPSA